MPNLNFTSSSFAQQDRYAQTTVSYESRNMQSIPFYPGVDHKAKLRGIMALTLVVTIIVGAFVGMLYGFRDYIIDWAKSTPVYSAVAEDEEAPPPNDDQMNIDPAALSESEISDIIDNISLYNTTVVYDGKHHKIEYSAPDGVALEFEWIKNGSSGNYQHGEIPADAGEYTVRVATLSINGEPCYDFRIDAAVLTIEKQAVPYPGISLLDQLGYPITTPKYDYSKEYTVVINGTLPEECSYTIVCVDSETGNEISSGTADNPPKIKNAGSYSIGIEVNWDKNYKPESNWLPETVVIQKKVLIAEYFGTAFNKEVTGLTYGSSKISSSLFFDPSNLPSNFPADLKAELEKSHTSIINYSESIDSKTPVGDYYISVESLNSKNYEFSGNTVIHVSIDKASLTGLFTSANQTTSYSPSGVPKHLLEITKKSNFPNVLNENISIEYTYYKGTTVNDKYKINSSDIVNVGTYTIVAQMSAAYNSNYIAPTDPIQFTLKITPVDIDTNAITMLNTTLSKVYGSSAISPKDYIEHIDGNINGIPNYIKATVANNFATSDVGKYEVVITLTDDKYGNYNPATIKTELVITQRHFEEGYYTIIAPTKDKQTVTKDGSLFLPTYNWVDSQEKYKDAVVEFYVGGRKIDGVNRLGTYDVEIRVSDKNNVYQTCNVTFVVQFNVMTILVGILIGIVSALIIAPSIWFGIRTLDKQSFKKFARLRARILHERGGARGAIVCEGRVSIFNWNSEQEIRDFPWTIVEPRFGRLYLTHATLEYYDSDYKKNYRNHLIQLKDITGIEIRGVFLRNKLIIFTKGGRFIYYVEPNTAYLWRRDITHFKNLQHLYPMENNVVDNDYPFNYTVITNGD